MLFAKYKKNNILGHADISPDRKKDPGEKFPWKILNKNRIGIWHNLNSNILIALRKKKISLKENKIFMINLIKFGYSKKSKKVKEKKYKVLLIKAFQRRFRPELVNGKIDRECLVILNKLIVLTKKNA